MRESAVVAERSGAAESVHAVLVLEAGVDPSEVIVQANRKLERHQQIRHVSEWPSQSLPRTEGTRKLKRGDVRLWLGNRTRPNTLESQGALASILARFAPGRSLTGETSLDDLTLSSLDRVELMTSLEQRFEMVLPEALFQTASTVADLDRLVSTAQFSVPGTSADLPDWPWSPWARFVRRVSLPTLILPLARLFIRLQVQGLDSLPGHRTVCVFAANHQSHLDGPAILLALPARFRYRLAPAMAREFFDAQAPFQRFQKAMLFGLASLFFGAFPIAKGGTGTREALRHAGTLADKGCSILIFPEGRMTDAGELSRFHPGAALLAAKLRVPLVLVHIEGLHRILHKTSRWPRRGKASVQFGIMIHAEGRDPDQITAELESALQRMREERAGTQTDPP
ncbi:MAG: 1-acyl-sn-glycerol-3-phosphate acyltransferase [Bryobacteraceae bacterium]|nr:1-acyl-sn-glycerol-3-phosphate acyltransferase [Bryobacteraceae bacterium]